MIPNELLILVEAPRFCAGIVVRDGFCIDAAPILRWAIGYSERDLLAVFKRRRWICIYCF